MAAEVRKTLQHVNRDLFGTSCARRHKVCLATYAIQEMTLQEGHEKPTPHTHMFVGVPEGSLGLKANQPSTSVPDLIIDAWIKHDPLHRRSKAQDAREIYEPKGLEEYVHKTINYVFDFDSIDLSNATFPEYPATVPPERDNP